jgi:hypothetical protein
MTSKSVFNVAYVVDEPDEVKSQWCLLRAIEWARLPLFVAQPIAPLAILVFDFSYVFFAVLVISWVWVPIRMSFVSLWLANFSSLFVHLKWPIAAGCGFYLAVHGNYIAAAVAAGWPLATLALTDYVPVGPIGILQQRFAAKVLKLQDRLAKAPVTAKVDAMHKGSISTRKMATEDTSDINLRAMLKADFGIDLPISGGTGNSRDAPVVIHYRVPNDYVAVEHTVLNCLGMGRRVEWKLLQQALIEHNGRKLDQMKIETKKTTDTEILTQIENYYFDVTECLGR